MKDTYLHKGKRRNLLEYLQTKNIIQTPEVFEAMYLVPRHLFLESIFVDFAYEDRAFTIQANQTISHPSTVAEQTELLKISAGEKILEIGTGSGYQTAILVAMKAKVYTIERQKELYDFSKKILTKMNLQPHFQVFGDGFVGLPDFAPFDKILVTCGASTLPVELLRQLKIGGILVIPLGDGEEQILTRFTKVSENYIEKEEFGLYKFVPMLGNTNQ